MSSVLAFARDELGLELMPAQSEMLGSFEAEHHDQAVWQCGRRGGKSLLADVLAIFDAAIRLDLNRRVGPGELRITAIIAPKLEQAAAHIRRCSGLIARSPRLSALVASETGSEIVFKGGSAIRAYPCSARGFRGDPCSAVILDEFAHFLTTEEGNAAGDSILEAAHPALAQFDELGWLIAISTPRWRQGAFAKLVERAQSAASRVHYRHLSTQEMNPRISAAWLEKRRLEDPDDYAREYLAEFVDGISSYLTSADVVAACRERTGALRPEEGFKYVGAIDPAFTHDAFAVGIAHRGDDGRIVVDGVWAWTHIGYEMALNEVEVLARAYRVREMTTDQHAAQPIVEGLAKRGIRADYKPWTAANKVDAYASLKGALGTNSVELPRDDVLVEELCNLEARPLPGGGTRIAAAGRGHDDRATVVAAVVHALSSRRKRGFVSLGGDPAPAFEFQPGWQVIR